MTNVCVLCDIKVKKGISISNLFDNKKIYWTPSKDDGTLGVAIVVDETSTVEEFHWKMHSVLRHRVKVVKVTLKGDKPGVVFSYVMVAVYAPTGNDSNMIRQFWKELEKLIRTKVRNTGCMYIVAGDVNGVMNHATDVYHPSRGPVDYITDECYGSFRSSLLELSDTADVVSNLNGEE